VLETSDRTAALPPLLPPPPGRTREKVLSACTATKLVRLDRGGGGGAAEELHEAPEDDEGVEGGSPGLASYGDSALTDAILVETSDGDLSAGAVGPPGPRAASEEEEEGLALACLAASFEPETPPTLALTNGTAESEPEDNADPGRLA